ncbi:hypothetical protein [Mesorhizobium sp.]|uniref:hypothetical protein n=1 Tax=Mesorhizobium sp. TaxID=1871066 RepID=UPI001208C15B|nr:hypothetical protein [Mesorhizobium sp.]TIM04781.1 MAG: hypothetical protein E5Y62_30530 [Mesorhizobium sp.]TIM27864.1 MAG: hypothetical protein E5Y61_22925 [Mesorhizobium sp.]
MKVLVTLMAGIAMAGCISMAAADPWKDESGHGKWQGRYQDEDDYERKRERYSYKKEFRRGNCKIDRKWEGDEYKEEVKCKRGFRRPAYIYRY